MEDFERLKQMVAAAQEDVDKCDAGNKAAGTRVRKHMQEIKKACQIVREKIMQLRDVGSEPPAQA